MRSVWNKGLTKETSISVRKISETMRRNKTDNFRLWRKDQKENGRIPSYAPLKRNGDLAELIGVILGDGTITKFPRTEGLRIVGNATNVGFIKYYGRLITKIFGKSPHIAKRSQSNAVNITLYQCHISRRLGIPTGAKGDLHNVLPAWISNNEVLLIRYLRGLYEAEGSYCVHEKTYTHKLIFSNTNPALLTTVFESLKRLGFTPHVSQFKVQISRKLEVQNLKNLLGFRCYEK